MIFVLVHSPLVGASTWRGVADALVARGHRAIVPDLPFSFFEEPAPTSRALDPARAIYVRWTEPYDAAADEAERRGWRTVREARDHLAMITRPEEIAGGLASLARSIATAT